MWQVQAQEFAGLHCSQLCSFAALLWVEQIIACRRCKAASMGIQCCCWLNWKPLPPNLWCTLQDIYHCLCVWPDSWCYSKFGIVMTEVWLVCRCAWISETTIVLGLPVATGWSLDKTSIARFWRSLWRTNKLIDAEALQFCAILYRAESHNTTTFNSIH